MVLHHQNWLMQNWNYYEYFLLKMENGIYQPENLIESHNTENKAWSYFAALNF